MVGRGMMVLKEGIWAWRQRFLMSSFHIFTKEEDMDDHEIRRGHVNINKGVLGFGCLEKY